MTEKALTIRENGGSRPSNDDTKQLWASAGTGTNAETNRQLGMLGDALQLSAALGEVILLGGKAYVALPGYITIAHRQRSFAGIELFPLTMADREAMMIDKGDHAWKAVVHRSDKTYAFVGYGRANTKNTKLSGQQGYDFLMEQAQCRAIRRALKLAFNVTVPEYTEDEFNNGPVTVTVKDLPLIESPPKEPTPEWPSFWRHCTGLGVDGDQVHRVLGVGSVNEWQGSLDEAIQKIEEYVLTRDTTPEPLPEPTVPHEAEPTHPNSKPMKGSIRAAVEKRYRTLVDRADGLNVPADGYDPQWTDEQLKDRGTELVAAVREAEIKAQAATVEPF